MAEKKKNDVCPICGGTGWVIPNLPPGHPDYGIPVPCVCQREALRKRKYEELLKISNLGALAEKAFDNFDTKGLKLLPSQRESLQLAYDRARSFAQNPDGWLVLLGDYGCGKTHLAAAIANERMKHGHPALFVVVPDLLDYLRAAYAPGTTTTYDDRFEEIRSAPLLILDDLGTHNATPWAEEKLFQILNYRYNGKLPTVITSNQPLEDLPQRLRSRMLDPVVSNVIPIQAPDYRNPESAGMEISILSLLDGMTFEQWDPRKSLPKEERENLAHAFSLAMRFSEDPKGWLTFSGTYGCGKTHLAAAIAHRRVAKGEKVLFVVVADLLDHLRAAFNPRSPITYDLRFERVRRIDFLVLDDLGTENATPWAKEKLFQILNYRYNASLPTVITTAHPLDEIDPWLVTRIMDSRRSTYWGIIAPSYRGGTRPKRGKSTRKRG